MPESRDYPRLELFERWQIRDGMPINAECWQHAHTYHRHRQNFHYQSLYEPGIVYGLGVAVVPDQPDGRLLQVQPGVAIDIAGNPIIVQSPEEFRLTSAPNDGQALVVYLVVNYVDPDDLRLNLTAKTQYESFRIVEKLHLDPQDIELCRIDLQAGVTQLQAPTNVFAPSWNQLDFRDRRQPQPQPQLRVRVGLVTDESPDSLTQNGFTDLLRSLPGLYPTLHADSTLQTFSAQALGREFTLDCQLLHIPYHVLLALPNPAIQRLQSFLARGGIVLAVADFDAVDLLDLLDIGQELRLGLLEAERDRDLFNQTGIQLQQEITANQSAITEQITTVKQSIAAIASRLGVSSTEPGELSNAHPLQWQPFTFSQLPTYQGHPIILKNWDGLVLMLGDLTRCWSHSASPPIPRETLRSAQEWGINLLHFAAQRQQWTQALIPITIPPDDHPDSLQRRVSTEL
ncbi:MAG: hypothetical protein DCF22_09470 [Leptolyngbya sp.]|nr:MAG: hypothetical protein DCF22_09470 [Leptolyngbya sp.]